MNHTVTTQAELDDALADESARAIYIDSPSGVWLTIKSGQQRDSARVEAWGSARVEAWGSARVVARDSAHVVARDSAHVEAWDSARVEAWGSARVEAWGSARVEARDSAHVVARDSAHVEAKPYVAVHLHSARATVVGGVVIDIAALDQKHPQTWCDMQGVEVEDGHAVVYKAVDDELRSGRGFAYPLGGTVKVTKAEWRADGECGAGLHFGPTPRHAKEYFGSATRFLACRIPLDSASGIPGSTAKIKARVCVVLHEVNIDGEPLPAEAVAS